jgi:hypothetical protein
LAAAGRAAGRVIRDSYAVPPALADTSGRPPDFP